MKHDVNNLTSYSLQIETMSTHVIEGCMEVHVESYNFVARQLEIHDEGEMV